MERVRWILTVGKRYLFKDTGYLFLSLYRYLTPGFHNNAVFYTDQELADLIKSGKSILRIGDGEIGLLHFCPAAYQVYSDAIRNDFLSIIKNYNDQLPYLLGITEFVNYTNAQLRNFVNTEGKKINRFPVWRQFKITYEMIFNKNAKYFDALAFYKAGGFEKLVLPYITNKKVIIVTNWGNQEMIAASPLALGSCQYITCADENTYEDREKIKQDIIKLITESGQPKSDFVILFAGGLAKTIVHDLAGQGYQILDIGWGLKSYHAGKSIENLI